SGVMLMFTVTNVLVAGPLPPGPAPMLTVAGSVSRVSDTPPTEKVTDALPVTSPTEFDVNVTVHWPPLVPGLAHVSPVPLRVWVAPFESVNVTVGFVPSGTFTRPAPLPRSRLTVTVNVWSSLTSFVAVGGVMVMLASTNVFTTG